MVQRRRAEDDVMKRDTELFGKRCYRIIKKLELVLALIDDSKVEKVFMDAADLLLSSKLCRLRRGLTLDQVSSWIEEHVINESDPTQIIREMRDRSYDS